MHQYQQEFNASFELGFALNDYPFLVDKSWHNDTSPSFYFKRNEQYLVLWVDYVDPDDRESSTARYVVVEAYNEGDSKVPEIYCGSAEVVFESDLISELGDFLRSFKGSYAT
ncbi:hypothetical protein [Shewanella benthica]|uniref:Uncharacterized protein n=1 Tax=Shewanella benthica KT99 TaxID=314608 RepID=A9CZP6_9GAMM|nr:hypothetical protein [Shewanella benthica]EDQ02028.1 hypothetical protein KT99_19549 [Shewanella benthica KT99]